MATDEPDTGGALPAPKADNRTLIRDAAVLQVKLVIDGLRDLLLVPASIIAAVMSLIDTRRGKSSSQFYDLLAIGKRSEHWIDLFGALRDREVPGPDGANIDDVVNRIETYVIEEYRRGGLTKQAKDRIDQALAALHKRR